MQSLHRRTVDATSPISSFAFLGVMLFGQAAMFVFLGVALLGLVAVAASEPGLGASGWSLVLLSAVLYGLALMVTSRAGAI